MFLSDNETEIDLLNNKIVAQTVVRLIRDDPERPITVGVHGDWGAGKSSVLLMIERDLEGMEDVLCLRFNGWLFQGFEDAKVVLIEQIVQGILEARSGTTKVKDAAKKLLKRIDWLRAAKKAGGLAFTAFTGVPSPDLLADLGSLIEKFQTDPSGAISEFNLGEMGAQVASLVGEPEGKHLPKEIHEFRDEFRELIEATGVGQLIVLIDDLDRCLPKAAVETLEALRLFLWMPKTAFVIAADEAMIEYAVREHFPDLPASAGPLTYARNYLEKLVQVPFRIPALGVSEARIYITLLLVSAEIGEGTPEFSSVVEVARRRLGRPWEGAGLSRDEIEEAVGADFMTADLNGAIRLSEQIGRVLALGASGNPRQIKRFLNSYLLRYEVASELGFADEIQRPVLAKLMLAEQFAPRFFDHVASEVSVSSAGQSEAIRSIEASILDGETADEVADVISGFLNDETIQSWIRIEPKLTEYDLRPYAFVARDKRGYFGGPGAQDPLDQIADSLMASDLVVQSRREDVARLNLEDARRLFGFLSGRIVQSDRFEEKPPGAAGLALVALCHPELKPKVLQLLESLPVERLGPWAVSGWHDVVTGGLEAEFDCLLGVWESHKANSLLSGAAAAARRLSREHGETA